MTTPHNEPDLYVTIYSPSLKHRVVFLRALRATLLHHLPEVKAQLHALDTNPLSDHFINVALNGDAGTPVQYPLVLVDAPQKDHGQLEYASTENLPQGARLAELLAAQADYIRQDVKERIFTE